MLELFKAINNLIWGPPLLLLLVGTGVYLTLRLGVFQIGKLPTAFRLIFSSDQSGQEMCPALYPLYSFGGDSWYRKYCRSCDSYYYRWSWGSFWMWVYFFGMATKYAEGFWPSNIEPRMQTDKRLVGLCIISP